MSPPFFVVVRGASGCGNRGSKNVASTGASPNPKAPPLREIARKYKPEDLEEAFAEGIMVGHQSPDMPAFELEPAQIDALTAYLRALKR